MKRTVLSLTTAIALALPGVAAANSAENTVENVLNNYGYPAGAVDMLSEAEIAEIYLTATSEDRSDLRVLLDGITDLPEPETASLDTGMEMDTGADMPVGANTEVGMQVYQEMMERGYDAEDFAQLSDGEKTEIFILLGSEDNSAVETAIEGAIAS